MEISFTEDKIHEHVHYVYEDQFLEDGVIISTKIHREIRDEIEAKSKVKDAIRHVQIDPVIR